jgi:hypothetical protein
MEEERMTKSNLLLSLAASGVACLALAGAGEAQVPRAFVSINGSDTNPCSAVQPCRSFNQALTVVEAGGEIVVQNSGGYSTGFTITKSVTIDAAGVNASVINTSDGDLCTINAGSSDRVVLRGISFHGASFNGNGIRVLQVGSLYVEHCSISEFVNGTAQSGDGVRMENGGNIWVTDTDIRLCFDVALRVGTGGATPANLVAHDSRFSACPYGVAVVTSGTGTATAWLSNCTASLCDQGFFVGSFVSSSGNANMALTNCRAFGNFQTGFAAQTLGPGRATILITGCVATQNSVGIALNSGGGGTASVIGTSPGTNLISGNTSGNITSSSVTLQ